MRIAIIGGGIAGLTTAYLLHPHHDIVVYEAEPHLGGHTATVDVRLRGQHLAIDTGFIVFNDRTYPYFNKLLARLGVATQPTSMGFSVTCERTDLEYSGTTMTGLFAQKRNLLRPGHWRMLRDILRFNRQAPRDLARGGDYTTTLGTYLTQNAYSREFVDFYLLPMGSAIWSASLAVMQEFPLQFFVRFFQNHGLLSLYDRPQWFVIKGGSRNYIEPLVRGFSHCIHTGTPVQRISRNGDSVKVIGQNGSEASFDQVVLACHSDQALHLLADASTAEQAVLSAIAYQRNQVVLHTDTTLLPHRPKAWSSWNYRILDDVTRDAKAAPVLTYNMNILQSLPSGDTFCVTLNHTAAIDPAKIIGRYDYAHPVFSLAANKAQQQWQQINGVQRTWFCGAYWGNGFHEDGVRSALRVAEALGVEQRL